MSLNSQLQYNHTKTTVLNTTPFAICVESWIRVMDGLSSLEGQVIQPGQHAEIPSITGEWYYHNLVDGDDWIQWKKSGYKSEGRIGKFTTEKTHSGEFAWSYFNEFTLEKTSDGFRINYLLIK